MESSRNQVLRYQGVDIDPVNWGWLCDKGRFGFEAVVSDERLTQPLVRRGDALVPRLRGPMRSLPRRTPCAPPPPPRWPSWAGPA